MTEIFKCTECGSDIFSRKIAVREYGEYACTIYSDDSFDMLEEISFTGGESNPEDNEIECMECDAKYLFNGKAFELKGD